MNRDEYLAFVSEINELELLLAKIPIKNVFERMSLESRLKSARSAIEGIKEPKETYKAKLVFRGKPVTGSHGISANFGSKAASTFSEVITAISAGLTDNLQDTGPIPDKQKNQLLITGVAVGSFGFEFELPQSESDDVSQDQRNVEKALNLVQDLFQRSAAGSDDDIAEIIAEIHPRAIKKIAEFLNYVAQHEAWCGLDFKNRSFRFQNLEQISTSSNRLQENNIHEEQESLEGEFQGFLPSGRTFEFKLLNKLIIVKGTIGPDIKNPDILNHSYLHKHVRVLMNVTRVGTGRPRYKLVSLGKITVLSEDSNL